MLTKALALCSALLLAAAIASAPSPTRAGETVMSAEEIAFKLAPSRGIRAASTPATQTTRTAGSVDLSTITFEFNSADLTDLARRQLAELGRALTMPAFKGYKFIIGGHTDAVGSAAYNQALSERRAKAVATYLTQNFALSPDRLTPIGWGETRLKPGIDPEDGANRRVEIISLGRVK